MAGVTFDGITKTYPDGTTAVDGLDLEITDGEFMVLVGPSGCGKTTAMRMVNRMIDITDGDILIGGESVRSQRPAELRRKIGYVIQQIGLFPHMTIAGNVATVPRLLGWTPARIDARVDEMLALVGLDPGTYRARYPRALSGGERQRVGVARALAGDPPVMLMDEPFGAVDPITRTRLQNEFLNILRELRKTIVFVTHDIDEAIRMGDRIAILRHGRLVQYGAPAHILAHPADAFVEEFVGADRALKRLGLLSVREAMTPVADGAAAAGGSIAADANTRDALSLLLATGVDALAVVADGKTIGRLTLAQIQARAGEPPPPTPPPGV